MSKLTINEEMTEAHSNVYKLLICLQGGGARGARALLPAQVLRVQLEQRRVPGRHPQERRLRKGETLG